MEYEGEDGRGPRPVGQAGQRVLVSWVTSDRMQVGRVLLLVLSGQIVVATQPETEQVSLSAVYSFLTDDLVVRRFYVQIIAQVNTQHSTLNHLNNIKLCLIADVLLNAVKCCAVFLISFL